MRKLNTYILSGLALFFISCSSDDGTPTKQPVTETVYHLSNISLSRFYEEYSEDVDFEPQLFLNVIYNFTYDSTFHRTDIERIETRYFDNGTTESTTSNLSYTLNEQNRLTEFHSRENDSLTDIYRYNYENDLLQTAQYDRLKMQWNFTSHFTYNDKKQCIFNNTSAPENLIIDMKYNDLNQISQIKLNGRRYNLAYDDKRSPFYALPFDLTTDLLGYDFAFPYTYKFPNNITTFQGHEFLSTVDFTYNEVDLPLKAKYYNNGLFGREIVYTYIKQEVTTYK